MKRLSLKISYILTVVVIIGILLFSIGFISRFTNNFTSEFKTFYVEYNNKKITNDCKDILFKYGSTNKVNVGYSLEFLDKEKKGYTVQVLPNVTEENDFEYSVDEEKYLFSKIGDLTEYFEIEKSEDNFTIKATMGVFKILKKKYEGKNVTFVETDGKNLLKLVVGSIDGSIKINMAFAVTAQVENIQLNENQIIFGDKSLSITVVANNEYLTDINTSSTLALSNENIRVEFYYNDDSIYENFATVKITLKNKDTGKIISVYGLGSGVYCKDNEYMDFYFDFTMPYYNVEVVIDIVNVGK